MSSMVMVSYNSRHRLSKVCHLSYSLVKFMCPPPRECSPCSRTAYLDISLTKTSLPRNIQIRLRSGSGFKKNFKSESASDSKRITGYPLRAQLWSGTDCSVMI